MYFSIGAIKHDRAAQLAVVTAQEFGEQVLAQKDVHVPFETVVCTLNDKLKRDLTVIAAQLLTQDEGRKHSALKVGFAEIIRTFGGEEAAMNFFRQVTTPRVAIRFESVGGVRDDVHSAKNRSAALASKAIVERWRDPNRQGYTPGEREYVDYLKSIRRTLDKAADDGCLKTDFARALVSEIEEAAYTDQRPSIRGKVMALQVAASEELYSENRNQLIRQYAEALQADKSKDSGPTVH